VVRSMPVETIGGAQARWGRVGGLELAGWRRELNTTMAGWNGGKKGSNREGRVKALNRNVDLELNESLNGKKGVSHGVGGNGRVGHALTLCFC
jgi:hypothetical protein